MNKITTLLLTLLITIVSWQSYAQTTLVPDPNFEQALITLGLDLDLTLNGQVPTVGISSETSLDISGKNISDLTGLSDFIALENLNCSNNNLSLLDTEFNQQLTVLNASNNNLTNTPISFSNLLTDINLSNNANLLEVDLSVFGNLSTVTLNNMTALNTLKILNGNNVGITTFSALNNPNLNCIEVSNVGYAEGSWANIDAQVSFSLNCVDNSFKTTWQTTTANESITIPTTGSGFNYTVNWGDGVVETGFNGNATHTYVTAGIYTIRIEGAFPRIYFNNTGDKDKILSIEQWGDIVWSSNHTAAFKGCSNLVINATDIPDLSNGGNFSQMFWGATSVNSDISNWNMSAATALNAMFRDATSFNQSLANWDISNVANANNMLLNTNMSTVNYDATLIGWNNLASLRPGVNLVVNATYCASSSARQNLINTYSWNIIDNGLDTSCPNLDAFLTTWQTTTVNESITIPIIGVGYNYTVDWGDGTINTAQTGSASHTYTTAGIYQVKITGVFPQIYFNNSADKDKILSIDQWGSTVWRSMANAFYGCSNLVINATDAPDLSNTTTTGGMFWLAQSLTGGVSHWDVSTITFMVDMFNGTINFNDDISGWDVSNVIHTSGMFSGATVFNQDLSNWETTSLTHALYMFNNATSFNGNISTWQLSTLIEMDGMFNGATSFNQDISTWDVSNVVEMDRSFSGATAFNQNIGSWNTSSVTEMHFMFNGATSFNQNLSAWNVSNVGQMQEMFNGATAFDQSLANWDIGNVTNMTDMFFNTGLSTIHYDATLIGWNSLPSIQNGVNFNAGSSNYCASEQARQSLINAPNNWIITDANQDINCGVQFLPVVFLEGAASNPNAGEENLMRDDLRLAGEIPTTSPYADGITCSPAVFAATGVDAIVDWVWVELRDATDNTIIVDGKSALLSRGGSVFDIDGFSPINLNQLSNNYHIAVSHRNHIGIISNITLPLSNVAIQIDLTSDATVLGGNLSVVQLPNGLHALYGGDVDGNKQIQNADILNIIQLLGATGYDLGDLDMNGQIQNIDLLNMLYPNIGKGQQF